MASRPAPVPAVGDVAPWIVALIAMLNLVAGVVVLAAPKGSLQTIAIVLGVYLVGIGLIGIGNALLFPQLARGGRGTSVLVGLVAIAAGIVAMARPGAAVQGVALAFGIYLICSGLLHFGMAAAADDDRVLRVVRGSLELAAGIIVVSSPKIGTATLALILGIYLLVRAFTELAAALALHRERKLAH